MILLRRKALTSMVLASLCITVAAAYPSQRGEFTKPRIGIEITSPKPFYIPAATSNKVISAFIRIPVKEGEALPKDSASAIKLEPKVERDKVRVTLYALFGDTDNVRTCDDWDSIEAVKVDSYLADLDEEISVPKLKDYGVDMGEQPLTFRVVSRSVFAPVNDGGGGGGGGCGCSYCDLLTCCPNRGFCLPCDTCGTVCCRG